MKECGPEWVDVCIAMEPEYGQTSIAGQSPFSGWSDAAIPIDAKGDSTDASHDISHLTAPSADWQRQAANSRLGSKREKVRKNMV